MIGVRMTTTANKTRALVETATLVGESADSDGAWKVLIINEGKGSSGLYTSELLETHATAFTNALSFKNHPTGWDGPESRDFTMIAGRILGETWSERGKDGRMGIYGRYLPDPEYADRIERYKAQLGLSIYIEGAGDLNESGEFEVQWLNEADPYKSVDVVIAPGRGGKLAVESLRKMYSTQVEDESGPTRGQENGEENEEMDEKVLEALEALNAKLDAFVTAQEAVAAKAAEAEEVEDEVASAVEAYDAAIAAIDAAELLPPQVTALRAEAKAGRDVAPLIENAKETLKALQEAQSAAGDTGRVVEGSGSTEEYTLRGFGGRK